MKKDEKTKHIRIFVIVIAALAVVISIILIIYCIHNFNKTILEEHRNSLGEITDNLAEKTNLLVNDMELMIEMAGGMINSLPKDENGTIFLDNIKEKYNFEYVGYAKPNGELVTTTQSAQTNISGQSYFKKGMNGESIVEYEPLVILNDKVIAGLRLSTPIYNLLESPDKPVGVLITMININELGKALKISSYNGQGVTYVIDENGTIIFHTSPQDYSNLYMVLQNNKFAEGYSLDLMKSDLADQQAGFCIFSQFGVDKYMKYQYIGIDDWSVVTVIEKSVITEATDLITRQMGIITTSIMIAFPLLIIFSVYSLGISKAREQAAMTKSAFLANMSHEIRTPMNAIVGISEILMREELNIKQKNYVLSIINAGNGLLTIINDILDISKLDSGKFSIVEAEYEFESLIYDVVTITSIKIGEKPIELLVDIDPEMPRYVVGDMSRVKQVLLNLIGNAVKFTYSGYVKLSVHVNITEGKLELIMLVEDTGIGIKKEDLKQLFTSFAQVDTHKNHNLEGTGLGLVISKRLCGMMGGTVTVESVYEKGSVFTIKITQGLERSDKLMNISEPDRFKILLLEPSELLRSYFMTCMDRMNLRYEVCQDNENFIKQLETGGYTHALAKPKMLRNMSEEEYSSSGVNLVSLLTLQEQASAEDPYTAVMASLFTMQLAAVLQNQKKQIGILKRSGIYATAIYPMPYVNVLIIDDNEVNLQVANGLMVPYQMQVDCALSAKNAFNMLRDKKYDIIFMDHMMPEMDGVEAVKIIRSRPEIWLHTVPIIAFTANVTHDARDLFMQSGFNDFLSKPIETVKLNEVLKKWLREKNDKRAEQDFLTTLESNDGAAHNDIPKPPELNPPTDYVDFETGIKTFGDMDIYCDILKTYCRSANDKLAMLATLLDTDIKRFTIEVHGLKGASGGILATPVAQDALELETLSKENEIEIIREKLPVFLAELKTTIEEIELFITENGNPSE